MLGNTSVQISCGNEQLLEASFSMRVVSNQRKVGDYFFPELLAL
jgi:hypothetical protein